MRKRLVELREAATLTQEDLAEKLGISAKSVYRHEAGERSPQMPTRRKMAALYKVPLSVIHGALTEDLNRHAVPSHLTHFASLEQAAREMRSSDTLAVNGLLQTERYAEAVERSSLNGPSDADVARRVEFRLARQNAIRREASPLRLYALLDASVLLRVVGSGDVMQEQLAHLREMSALPNVTIRVAPLDGRVLAASGTFHLLTGEGADPYIATTSNLAGVHYLETPTIVQAYGALFAHLWRTGVDLAEVELQHGQ